MKRMSFTSIAVMAAVLFTVTGIAHAQAINVAWHKHTSAMLKIATPTEVGGILLEPGAYEVNVRKNRDGGSIVEFTLWTYNPYAQEGLPVWDREVVATLKAVPQEMSEAATRTRLLMASSDGAPGLEIRGNNVKYLF